MPTVRTENKSDKAYNVIEAMIAFQELAPGAMVSEALLMETTGFGRSPVREALQRLARDRMVIIQPNRGVLVPAISADAQLKLLEVRRTLEVLAVRLASHRATTEQRESMLELATKMEDSVDEHIAVFGGLLKRDHELVTAATFNDFVLAAMAPLQGLSRRFWFSHMRDVPAELQIGAQFHGAILRAICCGDETEAQAAALRLNEYLIDFTYRTLGTPNLP